MIQMRCCWSIGAVGQCRWFFFPAVAMLVWCVGGRQGCSRGVRCRCLLLLLAFVILVAAFAFAFAPVKLAFAVLSSVG
jgi:hypothetical protein